jgi:hypothetical protein
MSTMVLPIGWIKHRSDGGVVTWAYAAHLTALPYLVIFKATDGTPTSKYQIKGVLGHDPSGLTYGDTVPNSIVEVNIRQVNDMIAGDRTKFDALINDIGDIISQPAFQADLKMNSLPYEGNQV